MSVDVEQRLVRETDGGVRQVRFEPGQQYLDGPRLAELLTLRQPGESELDRLPRVQGVLEALLRLVAEDPGRLVSALANGAPMLETAASVQEVEEILTLMAGAADRGALEFRTLPVSPVGSGEQGSFRADAERVESLVADRFAGSVPAGSEAAGRRLRILNGNGVPGVGQRVAERLLPSGFRVVLTGNADHFGYEETRIVIHSEDPDHLEAARRVRDLLGVGRVVRSGTPQSVVDITVVVGRDFVENAPDGPAPTPAGATPTG